MTLDSADDPDARPGEAADESGGVTSPLPDAVTGRSASKLAGPLAGVGGGVLVVRGLRRFRRGARIRGLAQAAIGTALIAGVIGRRRVRDAASSVDQTDVVDTAPDLDAEGLGGSSVDIEGAVDEGETEGEIRGEVGDTGESESEGEATEEHGSSDRLGGAAFDDESSSLPVPQQAFDREFLTLDTEVTWGIRDDDAVIVSGDYDSIEEREDTSYVASSRVDDERSLRVPSEILEHWNDLAEGVAVESGDTLVFATSDDPDDGLLIVPEQWAEDVLGGTE